MGEEIKEIKEVKEEEKGEKAEEKREHPYKTTLQALDWEKELLQRQIEVLRLRLERCELEKKLKEVGK